MDMRRFKWIEWNVEKTMIRPEPDRRSSERRAQDEQIASEPKLPFPEMPHDAPISPIEVHLGKKRRRPLAVPGIVENGLVRPLDPTVTLSERSRVIIVVAEVGQLRRWREIAHGTNETWEVPLR
jgi:hypothetical protein